MKSETERMEIIYTFYYFALLKKVIKKLLTFCYWQDDGVLAAGANCFAIVAGGLRVMSHQTTQKGRIWLLYPAPFLYWDKNETQHPRVSFEFRLSEQFCLTFVPSCVAMYRHVRFPYKLRDDMEMPRYSIY